MKNKTKMRILSILLCFVMLTSLMPTTVFAAQQEISAVVATSSNLDTIPTLYGLLKIPTFNITQGAPAYITASDSNLRWQKNIGGVWTNQVSGRFTPGEWRISTSLRLDNDGALQYDFAQNLTFAVNGNFWTVETPNNHGEYSLAWVYSPAFTIVDDPNVQPPIAVESVHMVLKGYAPGAAAASATVTTDANVTVEVLGFLEAVDSNGDGNPDATELVTGNFASGKLYAVALQIKAKPGYDISGLTMYNVSLDRAIMPAMGGYNSDEDVFAGMYVLGDAMQYTVTFETNGGSAIQPVLVGGGGAVTEPTAPTKAYYAFAGWFSDEELTKPFDFENTPITENTTLYAKWTPSPIGGMFLMTIDFNGGTSTIMPSSGEIPAGSEVYFETANTIENVVTPPSGKVFDAYEIDGVRYEHGDEYFVTQNFTLKLIWKDAPSVPVANAALYADPLVVDSTLDYALENTGTPPYTTKVRCWYEGGSPTVPGPVLQPSATIKPGVIYVLEFEVDPWDGYVVDNSTVVTVNGWNATRIGTVSGSDAVIYRIGIRAPYIELSTVNAIIIEPVAGAHPTYNITSAEPDKYSVAVNYWYKNEGSYPTVNEFHEYEAGKSYTLRVVFTPKTGAGYIFTDATQYTVNGKATSSYGGYGYRQIDFDVIAPTTYTVSFDANGGSGTMADINNVLGDFELPSCGFVAPDGKMFKAWSVGESEKAVGDTITVNANTTVTAVWEDIPPMHVCDIKPVKEIEASCSQAGKDAYYKCEGCGKFFEDANGRKEITDISSWGNRDKLDHEYSELKSDKDNHWNECKCSDKKDIAKHTDDNNDGKCDVCRYDMGTKEEIKPENKPDTNTKSPQTGYYNYLIVCLGALLIISGFGIRYSITKVR